MSAGRPEADAFSSSEQFSTEQRVWLLERRFDKFETRLEGLESVLTRILWAIIGLVLTILGSVTTFLVVGAGGGG